MTAPEELTRAGLRRYDPLIPAELPPAAMAHRPLGAHEGKLPKWLREPYGPDEIVFGSPAGPLERGEPGLPWHNCAVHQVGWSGPGGCWCCSANVPAVRT